MKRCGKCKIEKPVEKFSKNKSTKDGLSSYCKECASIHHKKFRLKNKKRLSKYHKEYRLENLNERRNYDNVYYLNNSDRIKANTRKYAQTENGRAIAKRNGQSRRAIKAGACSESFNSSEVFERDKYICQMCGVKTLPELENYNSAEYPNLDHIIPLSRGGNHTKENTQCLCHRCNMIKGASYIDFDLIKEKDNKNVKCSV